MWLTLVKRTAELTGGDVEKARNSGFDAHPLRPVRIEEVLALSTVLPKSRLN